MQTALIRSGVVAALAVFGLACNQEPAGEPTPTVDVVRAAALGSSDWTVFPTSAIPANATANDSSAVELGVQFSPTLDGTVKGIRFYKGPGNTGTHVGNLWGPTGQLLASATFVNETSTGWQEVRFASPVSVSANVQYVASYHAPVGQYSYTYGTMVSGINASPLVVPSSGGVFQYGSTSSFPSSSWNNSDYGVDVIYTPVANYASCGLPTRPTNLEAAPLAASAVDLSWWGASEGCGESRHNVTHHLVYRDSELIAVLGSGVASFRDNGVAPSTTYRYSVRGRDVNGNVGPSSAPVSVTTGSNTGCTACSLWTSANGPANILYAPYASEYGVKFRSDVAGQVTTVRYYKGMTNSDAHVGHLWAADGTLLGTTATSAGEQEWGWRELTFATPVQIAANTTYVVSYFAPTGYPAYTGNYFVTAGVDAPPLHAPSTPAANGNGLRKTTGGGFPNEATSANYWVDVVFVPAP